LILLLLMYHNPSMRLVTLRFALPWFFQTFIYIQLYYA
jgi:hypothetical protein